MFITKEEKSLLKLSKKISKFCVGMEGNISTKTSRGFLVKTSGSKLSDLKKKDLVEYNFKNQQLNNFKKRGSIELEFHSYLLSFDEINFVCHTHPINTLKILCTDHSKIFSEIRLFPEQVVFNGLKSCLVPYANPGRDLQSMIQYSIDRFIDSEKKIPKLILLENHGIIVCGKSIEECIMITEICEKSAEIYLGSSNLGGLRCLNSSDIEKLNNDDKEKFRQNLIK